MAAKSFESAAQYLAALAENSALAIVSASMAADALGRSRAGVLLMLKSGKLDEIIVDGSRYVRAQSATNIENDRLADVKVITKKLEQIARERTLTTYEPMMDLIGLRNIAPDRNQLGSILGRVSEQSYEKNGLLLSTLVCRSVNGKPTMPGDGYWPLAEELLDTRIRKDARENIFRKQLRAIYAHYAK